MDENDEIKKDIKALREYCKNGNLDSLSKFAEMFGKKHGIPPKMLEKSIKDESSFHISYYDTIKNPFGLKTPARIKTNGIIEVDKQKFMPDKDTPEYHRLQLNMFSRMTMFEAEHIQCNIKNKISVTNKRIREWFDYADSELKQYDESKTFLKNLGEEVKADSLAVGIVSKLKYDLVKKFWLRMGWFGFKQRVKLLLKETKLKWKTGC